MRYRQTKLVPDEEDASTENSENENGKYDPRNKLNDLTGKEWIKFTSTIVYQKGLGKNHPETEYEKLHPAPFSFTNVMELIKFFTKKNETVLDPFMGVGSTLKAAIKCNRKGIGIEISKKWIDITKKRLNDELSKAIDCKNIILGDAFYQLDKLKTNQVDFVVTSPPYFNILRKKPDHKVKEERLKKNRAQYYSENPDDLGNFNDYEEFITRLCAILKKCQRILKANKYLCVIVSDFRHKSKYVPLHSDLYSNLLDKSELSLEGIKILVQNAKKLYPYGYPYAYVPNIHHQYILIFRNKKEE